MPIRHELRSGNNFPKVNPTVNPTVPLEPRWSLGQYGSEEDEDKLYDPDWDIADTDLESYIDISQND